jgi:folate-binding protein YgfZ
VIVELERDFLRVAGSDAISFLQGQVSQDVVALEVGGSAWSFILQPQGKVDALVRLTRTDDDAVVIDVERGFGPAVAERLGRFKLRVKATIEPQDWRCVAFRDEAMPAASQGAFVVVGGWEPGGDVIGPPSVMPALSTGDPGAYEAARIAHAWPAMGAELTERTIPEESGIVARTVSFTKGCYTGQELVARIDSRGGNVPRRLRLVVLEPGSEVPPVGASLVVGTSAVGELTSASSQPTGGPVALAYVARSVEPPADASITWDGVTVAARIETPLLS